MIQKKEEELLQEGFRFALSLTNNRHDAEDLIQECWIKLYEKSGCIESKNLLFTVIRNRFIDIYRKRKREQPELDIDHSDNHRGVKEINNCVEVGRVKQAMEQLKPKEREILFLQCVEQYSASEISSITGQPRGSILSIISRSKAKLKKLLGFQKEQAELLQFERSAE